MPAATANDPATGSPSRFVWQALGAFATCVALTWTVGAVLQGQRFVQGLLLTELLFFAAPAAAVLLLNWRTQGEEPFRPPRLRDVGWTVLLGLVVTVVAVTKGASLRRGLGLPLPAAPLSWPLLFALAVPAPLAEELLFRPVMQSALGKIWRPGTALAVTALLFGLIHGSFLRFPETFLLGVFSGIVFLKSGNYWLCVLFHLLANVVGPALWGQVGRVPPLFHPLTGVFLTGAALWLAWLWRRPDPHVRTRGAHLRWALFEANAKLERAPWHSAPATACWLGAGAMVVAVALVTTAELRAMRPAGRRPVAVGPQVRQSDFWTINTNGVISGRSRLEFERWPGQRDSLALALAYSEARPLRALIAGQSVDLRPVGAGTFELAWPEPPPAGPRTVEVFWELPVTALESPEQGYRARLQALLPVTGYSLTVALTPNGAYEFEHAPYRWEETVFSQASTGGTPRNHFGTCGLGLQKAGDRSEAPTP